MAETRNVVAFKVSLQTKESDNKPTISVRQALFILIDKYQKNKAIADELAELIFFGSQQHGRINYFLTTPPYSDALKKFTVSKDAVVTNNDATGRYFESQYAFELLKANPAAQLDLNDLQQHYDYLAEQFSPEAMAVIENVFQGACHIEKINGVDRPTTLSGALEYADLVKKLKSEEFFQFVREDRDKYLLIAKCAYLTVSITNYIDLPLNLYTEGFFNSANRGKIDKDHRWHQMLTASDESKREFVGQNSVLPHSLGIMRSIDPLPRDDELYVDMPIITTNSQSHYQSPYLVPFIRACDRCDFSPTASWSVDNFSYLVHSFSNSISGTMLLYFRTFKHLDNQGKFLFRDTDKLRNFIKSFVPLLLHALGGHSFHEFLYPLILPKIIDNFPFVKDFHQQLNLKALFFDKRNPAFLEAIKKTIIYNNNLLNKILLNHQIKLMRGINLFKRKYQANLASEDLVQETRFINRL